MSEIYLVPFENDIYSDFALKAQCSNIYWKESTPRTNEYLFSFHV